MAIVLLPSLLAAEAGGQNRFEVDSSTIGDALRTLPISNLIFDERGELRGLVNVYVDGVDMRERGGLSAPLGESDEIRLVGAIAGGTYGQGMPCLRKQRTARRRPRTQ